MPSFGVPQSPTKHKQSEPSYSSIVIHCSSCKGDIHLQSQSAIKMPVTGTFLEVPVPVPVPVEL